MGRIWGGAGCEALSEIEEQEDGTMVQELTAFVLHVTDLKDVVVKGETKKVCTVPWCLIRNVTVPMGQLQFVCRI